MTDAPADFTPRGDRHAVELGAALSPKFDADGLIVAVATEADSGETLMVAHMNREALVRTIATGDVWFWSRSRARLWRKGEESGNVLSLVEMRVDCDQDAILLKVRVGGDGVACHQGYRSCFYRTVPIGAAPTADLTLAFDRAMKRVAER